MPAPAFLIFIEKHAREIALGGIGEDGHDGFAGHGGLAGDEAAFDGFFMGGRFH